MADDGTEVVATGDVVSSREVHVVIVHWDHLVPSRSPRLRM